MLAQRTCSRCSGSQYKILDADAARAWRSPSANDDYWFCPACDWGSAPNDDEEKLT